MKRCKCEHWQTCPTCYPQGFDEHGARKPVEIPSSREELQREITELREQVEKLTKERDALRSRRCEICGYLEHEREHTGCLRVQLLALAEQNAKMRSFLEFAWKDIPMNEYAFKILEHVMNLPSLATPILNKIKAEAYLEAAELVEAHHTWTTNVAAGKLLRTKADELGKEA